MDFVVVWVKAVAVYCALEVRTHPLVEIIKFRFQVLDWSLLKIAMEPVNAAVLIYFPGLAGLQLFPNR